MGPITEHHLMLFLIQFALLLGTCKLAGYLFEKMKQSSVTAELMVGIILGPAILGRVAPNLHAALFPSDQIQRSMLETVAWVGNFFLLMETGLEVNFSRIWKQKTQALKISMADLVIPVLIGFIPMYFLPAKYMVMPDQRILFALFMAAIMTISALSVAIRGLKDMNILKSDLGFLIISALTINDIVGWVFFTIILGMFAYGALEIGYVAQLVLLTVGFTALSLILLRKWVDKAVTLVHTRTDESAGMKVTLIILIGAVFGAITLGIGIHALFGFFIAGVVVGEANHVRERDRFVLNRLVYSIFVPIFFANIGLHIDFFANFDWFLTMVLLVVGMLARWVGALAGSYWSKQPKSDIMTIAISHTPGGDMHIVVGLLAYSLGLLTPQVLVAIIASAIFSTVIFGPWLSWAVNRMRKHGFRLVFGEYGVISGYVGEDQHKALETISQLASHSTGLTGDTILHGILQREEQISTAMGRGLAIPHARLSGLDDAHVFVMTAPEGVAWDSPDGKPVRLIIALLVPEGHPEVQIQLLSSLATAFQNRSLVGELVSIKDPHEIQDRIGRELTACTKCQLLGNSKKH